MHRNHSPSPSQPFPTDCCCSPSAQMGSLSRHGDSSSVLGGSHRSEIRLFPGGFPAAGTVSAFLNPHGRAVLLSHPECCCSLAPSPKTPETISTLLEVILRDAIDPAVKATSRKFWSNGRAERTQQLKCPFLLTASLKHQSYFTSQFHKGTSMNP